MKLYQTIASLEKLLEGNPEQKVKGEALLEAVTEELPRGSGFDNGTTIQSMTDSRIVFSTAFHHMDDHGFYCGWTEHKVVLEASLMFGFKLRVTGENKRNIKDYIGDVFSELMYREFDWQTGKLKP